MEKGRTLQMAGRKGPVLNLRPHLRQRFGVFGWAGGAIDAVLCLL
jgi:hypothetical protein